jgi:hypothetical protein
VDGGAYFQGLGVIVRAIVMGLSLVAEGLSRGFLWLTNHRSGPAPGLPDRPRPLRFLLLGSGINRKWGQNMPSEQGLEGFRTRNQGREMAITGLFSTSQEAVDHARKGSPGGGFDVSPPPPGLSLLPHHPGARHGIFQSVVDGQDHPPLPAPRADVGPPALPRWIGPQERLNRNPSTEGNCGGTEG